MKSNVLVVKSRIVLEIIEARTKFKPFNSWHEAYAVIKAEIEELFESLGRMTGIDERELVQVAAMSVCAISECNGIPQKWNEVLDEAAASSLLDQEAGPIDDPGYLSAFVRHNFFNQLQIFWESVKKDKGATQPLYTIVSLAILLLNELENKKGLCADTTQS
ncbi:MAG: hypothetical protein IPM56_16090 [Ignavibacteriales bacterium]|nr:MAG: hypothetical protein IPM56_16090 [Ignavibacteriales bacterium]